MTTNTHDLTARARAWLARYDVAKDYERQIDTGSISVDAIPPTRDTTRQLYPAAPQLVRDLLARVAQLEAEIAEIYTHMQHFSDYTREEMPDDAHD